MQGLRRRGDERPAILVVDDDTRMQRLLRANLERAGYHVTTAGTGADALDRVELDPPDLLVLDVMMPAMDGLTCLARLREFSDLAVILLTAKGEERDKVQGLDLGADDYLIKPFALEELMARVRAVLRRRGTIPQVLEVERLLVDEERGFAARGGRQLALTATELRLLAFLMRHRGQALSKDQLLTQVWGYDAYDPNLVEVHVSALRRKLEADGEDGTRLIHTVRGIGYRFSS
jgi:DNA-binding response OmpR family regulator